MCFQLLPFYRCSERPSNGARGDQPVHALPIFSKVSQLEGMHVVGKGDKAIARDTS